MWQQLIVVLCVCVAVPAGQWMDVEAAGSGWSGNVAANHDWLVRAINQAAAMIGSNRIGIYSSAYGWSVAMGGFADLAHFPMWYAQSVQHIRHLRGS